MHYVYVIIISIVILFIYNRIRKAVSKRTALEDTDLNTDLAEFRESHAVATVIKRGALDLKESIVQKYERMCILEPLANKNDTLIPQLIADYQDIISGKVTDPEGLNIPSEMLLGRHNPDYAKYISNQSMAVSLGAVSDTLRKENDRVVRLDNEKSSRDQFYAYLVEQGIPLLIVIAALTDEKLNTYTAEDWRSFCRTVKGYLAIAPRNTVQKFVTMFDDKGIVLDIKKFENFVVFDQFEVPEPVLVELIKGRISPEQAIRIISLVQESDYEWDEAMTEVLSEDLDKIEGDNLRKQYGWKG
jgi:hypothetical protein